MPAKKKTAPPAPAAKKKAGTPPPGEPRQDETVAGGRYMNEAGELIDAEGNKLED